MRRFCYLQYPVPSPTRNPEVLQREKSKVGAPGADEGGCRRDAWRGAGNGDSHAYVCHAIAHGDIAGVAPLQDRWSTEAVRQR